jgi:bacteriocin biosynthesis cyclodehydratase domain-containing protein
MHEHMHDEGCSLDHPALPGVPQLVPDLRIFEMPDGLGFQFHGTRMPVLVRGKIASAVLPWLIPLLDGSRELNRILDLRPAAVSPNEVLRVLLILQSKGLLINAESVGDSTLSEACRDDPVLQRQLLFWGRNVGLTYANESSAEVQRKLMTSRVVLVCDGILGAVVSDLLLRQGIGKIDIIEWSDRRLAEVTHPEGAAGCAVTACFVERSNLDSLQRRLEELTPVADLVVTALRSAPSQVFELINRVCIRHERAWLRAHDDGAGIEIGPCVFPGSSGCYVCMRLRQVSAADDAIEDELYQRHLVEHPEAEGIAGESIVMATCGASLLCAEATRLLTALALPALQGVVLRLSFDGRIEKNSFQRVPRCPECFKGEVGVVTEVSGAVAVY